MLRQYPRIMQRIEWLDISPNCHSWNFSWGGMDPEPKSSLKLVTISLDPTRPDLNNMHSYDKVINIQPTIQHLDHVIQFTSEPNFLKLGVLFVNRRSSRDVALLRDALESSFNLKDPSASTWERFEIGLPESWGYEKQSIRDTALDPDWIAYEVEKRN